MIINNCIECNEFPDEVSIEDIVICCNNCGCYVGDKNSFDIAVENWNKINSQENRIKILERVNKNLLCMVKSLSA